jgi:3-oxoacyl-[acyl-carrier protein] reductase
MIETPGVVRWLTDVGRQQGFGDDRARTEAYVLATYVHQTVNRFGRVADVADLVAYVASAKADFITGADLRVDGGASPAIN